jgi:hypothetical protein
MTQPRRNVIANVMLGVSILLIITFVVQHFMTPRPASHKDMAWLALAFSLASELVRGRRRRVAQDPD